jgi:glycosyltransferase involved in cell wall biosynthesis
MLDGLNRTCGAWADDAEVAVSEFVLDQMRAHRHARRLTRISNAIDPDAFSPCRDRERATPDSSLIAGFVGRLAPGKGLDVAILALAKTRERLRVRLRVAGDGPELPRLSQLARDAGVADAVEFLGMVHPVRDFWCACQVAIVPSDTWTESFCMAALEAMACGRPVIATRNGALTDLVRDGVTGTLVPTGDVNAVARAMISYAEQPARRINHGAAARRRSVAEFNLDDCARAYLQVFAGIDR